MNILALVTRLIAWLATFNKANIAAAVGIAASWVFAPIFHVNLSVQDQLELSGALAVLLHQAVYWTTNHTATGDFGVATGGAGQTDPPKVSAPVSADKGL